MEDLIIQIFNINSIPAITNEHLQFKFASKITETVFTNLNGFQWFTIQYVEWFRLVAGILPIPDIFFPLSEWIASDFDSFQSIQSIDFECLHWSKTIITDFNRFYNTKSREIKYCIVIIITSVFRNDNRRNGGINRLNEMTVVDFWK